jgi:glycosyltransferase involved in cell wall biosynthesis
VNGTQRDADRPDISVVIPTRNRRRLLALALASVLDQRGVRLEVIVVDEASTDDTVEMVRSIADPRVRLVRHAVPLGKSAARNRGIAESVGDWIAFLDDDDLWAPDKLRLQLQALRAERRAWAYTGAVNITDDHRILGGAPPRAPEEIAHSLPRVNGVPGGCSTVLVRKETLPRDGFDGRYRLCEDWDLWIRLARSGPPAWVCAPLVAYRFHGGNAAHDPGSMVTEAAALASRHQIPVDMARMHRRAAWNALRAGRRLRALRHYGDAIRCGDWRSLGRAAVALGHPAVGTDRLFDLLGRDEAWIARAQEWLEPLARLERNPA